MTNEAPGLPDAVRSGLAAMVGAGLLAGIAPAADAAGVWLLAGLVLAALIAVAFGLSTVERSTPVLVLAQSAGAAAIAVTFGRYLLPQQPKLAAVALLVVGTLLAAGGLTPPRILARIGVGVVLAVLAVFVAACLAIEPPPNAPVPSDPAGLPAAAALLVFGFLGAERKLRTPRDRVVAIGVALVIYLAVAGAALYQLGDARLALSPVPLRDALAAADASGIAPLLTVGAVVACVLTLLGVLDDVWANDQPWEAALAGVAMVLGVLLLTVTALMAVAVALMAGHHVLTLATSRRAPGRRPPRSARS